MSLKTLNSGDWTVNMLNVAAGHEGASAISNAAFTFAILNMITCGGRLISLRDLIPITSPTRTGVSNCCGPCTSRIR